MRERTVVVLITVAFVLVAVALTFPNGLPVCNGSDCFKIGPFSPTSSPGVGGGYGQAQGLVSVIFPGSVTYSDGTTTNLTASQNLLSTLTGTKGKPIASMKFAVQLQVQTPLATRMQYGGYIDEDVVQPSYAGNGSGIGASLITRVSHNTVPTQTIGIPPGTTTFALLSLNHPASDLIGYAPSPASGSNQSSYNYDLAGMLNVSLSTPYNKSASAIFAWPNTLLTVTFPGSGGAPPPPPPPPPPPSGISATMTTTVTNLNVGASAAASGGTPPYTYSWSWGDGASSTGQSVTHAYGAAGTYPITLTVRDSAGASVVVQRSVTVAPPSGGGGGGGGGGCGGSNSRCVSILSGPVSQGVRSQWYVLGQAPSFSVVSSSSSKSILKQLGIV